MPFFANSRQRLWIMTALREYQARLADALLAGKRDAAMALFCGEAERRSGGAWGFGCMPTTGCTR